MFMSLGSALMKYVFAPSASKTDFADIPVVLLQNQ
jgi:hypothetical protein